MKSFFVFAGQGAQQVGMGRDLYEAFPEAKAVFDEANQVLGYDLKSIIFEGPESELLATRNCQPAIYAVSCAALAVFRKKFPQVVPAACAGLSLGEYGALYAGNAFSFADGLKLLARRAELMDRACRETDGGMASILGGDVNVIREVCRKFDIDIANYNNPGQIVISGDREKVTAAAAELKELGARKTVVLNVAGAFHSRLMSKAGSGLAAVLAETPVKLPSTPVWHNFSAAPAASEAELKQNLASQVAGSVRWEECVRAMAGLGCDTMIEFGPGSVLAGLMRRTLPEIRSININSVESLNAVTI